MAERKSKEQRCSSNSSPNWISTLTDDLWDSILAKLASLSDVIRFGCVCKSCNSMVMIRKEKLRKLITHQPPWILITSMDRILMTIKKRKGGREKRKRRFRRKQNLYNFANGSEILNKLNIPPKYQNYECFGSSHGWLFYKEFKECVVTLLNPISGTVIRLPPITTSGISLKDVDDFILSSDPSLGSFEVLGICVGSDYQVVHHKFDDKFWTFSERMDSDHMFSFAFYKNCILGFDCESGKLYSLDIIHSSTNASRRIELKEIAQNAFLSQDFSPELSVFVETTNGDLLMVHRYRSNQYKIIKIIYLSGEFYITPAVNLGGDCLFLKEYLYGSNQCISVLASNFVGCRANSIYYTHKLRRAGAGFCKCIIEEFNLKHKSFQTKEQMFPKSDDESMIDTDFWLAPSIKHS